MDLHLPLFSQRKWDPLGTSSYITCCVKIQWVHAALWLQFSDLQTTVYMLHIDLIYSKLSKSIPSGKTKLLYFGWSPPWHVGWRLSGEGCHWEFDRKNEEFENIHFRFPWLSDTSEMFFGHDVPFLNYSDRLPHPSDKSFLLFAERLSSLARYSSGQTMPHVLYLSSICKARSMFWTWHDNSLAKRSCNGRAYQICYKSTEH